MPSSTELTLITLTNKQQTQFTLPQSAGTTSSCPLNSFMPEKIGDEQRTNSTLHTNRLDSHVQSQPVNSYTNFTNAQRLTDPYTIATHSFPLGQSSDKETVVIMAPPSKHRKPPVQHSHVTETGESMWQSSMRSARSAIFNVEDTSPVIALLIISEIILNVLVVQLRAYTEIDWIAYMQEVEGVINGTYDYSQLKGDTGPLVYPAGFVYIYMALYYVTSLGTNIRLAQYIYIAFYILTLVLVFNIYRKVAKLPPWTYIFICISYRVHSIYILRLFNDPVAMILLYAAINALLYDQWLLGCVLYSLGVSVKMNILLFAPGLLVLLLRRNGLVKTFGLLSVCALIQVVLGAPFLIENPVNYMLGAFNLGRQFLFKWTVNWRFLPEEVFSARFFHVSLLLGHLSTLVIFYQTSCYKIFSISDIFRARTEDKVPLSSNDIVRTMFVCNFVGMCYSRSLHYQFYVWYFHTLHYLLWDISMPTVYRLLILGAIEMCWNTYPSTIYSSGVLHFFHLAMLLGLLFTQQNSTRPTKDEKAQ